MQVFGYPRLGPAEIAFVDAVAADGSTVHLPYVDDQLLTENVEAAETLEERGWQVEISPLSQTWRADVPTTAQAYPHLKAEVRGVLAQIKALLADDAFYGREYGVPVRAFYRVPLAETRLGDWLRLLLRGWMSEGTQRARKR